MPGGINQQAPSKNRSRLYSNGGIQLAPYFLNDLVKWIAKEVPLHLRADIETRMNLAPEELKVMVDLTGVKKAVLDLIKVLRETMPWDGVWTFTTRKVSITYGDPENERPCPSGSCALFSLSFTGKYMDEAALKTASTAGMGMNGPAFETAFRTVRAHMGSINVENPAGRDARFNIYLPLLKEKFIERQAFKDKGAGTFYALSA